MDTRLMLIAQRVAKRAYWEPSGKDTRVLPDMNSQIVTQIFNKKPKVREDRELNPGDYGHSDHIPKKVVENKQ